MLNTRYRAAGFTVVELLVGLAVGLIVAAAVISVYVNTLSISGTTLRSSRLNQEMNSIMNILVNDIRRAGYWGGSTTGDASVNPFNQATTALKVFSWDGSAYTDESPLGSGSCIVYAYDLNGDGDLDKGSGATAPNNGNNEGFGFRWEGAGNAIEMKSGHTVVQDCTDDNSTWGPLTDATFIEIDELTFDLAHSKCLNTSEPNKKDEATGAAIVAPTVENFNERDCYYDSEPDGVFDFPPDTGERTVEIREVRITLRAHLVSEPEVISTLTQSVQVRNNMIIIN